MILALQLLIFLFLLACSAFFSGSEAALTSLPSLKAKKIFTLHPALSSHISTWFHRPHYLLTTILLGNNIVNMSLSSLMVTMALPLAIYVRHEWLELIVWIATTFILLVFGDIIPKIVAQTHPDLVSRRTLPLLGFCSVLFFPVFRPILWFIETFFPSLRVPPVSKRLSLTFEEVQSLIHESETKGHISNESGEMMRRVLEARQRTVADILQPLQRVDSVPLDLIHPKIHRDELFVDLLVETGRTRVPVFEEQKFVGYIHVLDLLRRWSSGKTPLKELVRKPLSVDPQTSLYDLLTLFRNSGEQLAFVESADGKLDGVVSLEDVLEEIVGEILDEYDLEEKKGIS
ncbi:MAG TPA: hemolysin family protein [Elusimicrobiota bacterium]|nr:hemolysin family protein [Elusimicrobiota bacterium]